MWIAVVLFCCFRFGIIVVLLNRWTVIKATTDLSSVERYRTSASKQRIYVCIGAEHESKVESPDLTIYSIFRVVCVEICGFQRISVYLQAIAISEDLCRTLFCGRSQVDSYVRTTMTWDDSIGTKPIRIWIAHSHIHTDVRCSLYNTARDCSIRDRDATTHTFTPSHMLSTSHVMPTETGNVFV